MSQDLSTPFKGVQTIYQDSFERIRSCHIAIIGLGGVGSWAAETLARSGVMKLTLIDLDEVCVSNINRQIMATYKTIGLSKVQALKKRILEISPECEVNAIEDFFTPETADALLDFHYDGIIDAIDSLGPKCHLISECQKREIPLIVTGGAGGKKEISLIQCTDLAKTIEDRLLYRVRKKLRRDYDFKKKKKWKISCVYSPEKVSMPPSPSGSFKLDCSGGLGSLMSITASFGIRAAHEMLDIVSS